MKLDLGEGAMDSQTERGGETGASGDCPAHGGFPDVGQEALEEDRVKGKVSEFGSGEEETPWTFAAGEVAGGMEYKASAPVLKWMINEPSESTYLTTGYMVS